MPLSNGLNTEALPALCGYQRKQRPLSGRTAASRRSSRSVPYTKKEGTSPSFQTAVWQRHGSLGNIPAALSLFRQRITPAGKLFTFRAEPQPLASGSGMAEHLGQHFPAQAQHGTRHSPYFPLRAGAAAVLKKIEQRPAVHGHHVVRKAPLVPEGSLTT